LAQIIINTAGVLLFLPFIMPFVSLMEKTSPFLPRQIANSHTAFNLIVSILLFPFVKQIASVVKRISPERDEKETDKKTIYIDENQYAVPSVAISEASRELNRMGEITAEMLALGCQALIDKDNEKAEKVLQMENELVNPIAKELDDFIDTLMLSDLSQQQQRRCFQVKTLLIDIERVGDMAEDIAQFGQERMEGNITFSDEAINELNYLWNFVHNTYSNALIALSEKDKELAKKVCQAESEFDNLYSEARQRHVRRLEEGVCTASANIIFTETLRNLERISDHADNIGVSVQEN
jgi:phosphate:Na+ symporter